MKKKITQKGPVNMSSSGDFGNPLRKFKLVFLGEQSGERPCSIICYFDFAPKCFNNVMKLLPRPCSEKIWFIENYNNIV